jgi:hypothetical protein
MPVSRPGLGPAWALTEGRESINPRPLEEARIFRLFQPHTIGFISYSEGSNDDVNKFVWSALGWNPDQDVTEILRQYSRYFIGDAFSESFAQGLLALERNWHGPLAANTGVDATLAQFQAMERAAPPPFCETGASSRRSTALITTPTRASVCCNETMLEDEAMRKLRETRDTGRRRRHPGPRRPAAGRAGMARADFRIGRSVVSIIGMQLSVPRYKAIGVDRGASLDTLDVPLNNRLWLERHFADARADPAASTAS